MRTSRSIFSSLTSRLQTRRKDAALLLMHKIIRAALARRKKRELSTASTWGEEGTWNWSMGCLLMLVRYFYHQLHFCFPFNRLMATSMLTLTHKRPPACPPVRLARPAMCCVSQQPGFHVSFTAFLTLLKSAITSDTQYVAKLTNMQFRVPMKQTSTPLASSCLL